ncbi:hypothetical protein [Flagellimonas pacifica]|uniref:Prenyltransferase n=1 Tax=Flagellimonas pacifica TaxID=1247520 RepID=A0A285MVF5_9FLAO|nr:hypothetical protein [Allomuricauda parva]SNZ01175.1 hypothetical protein SAMN06265377_3008 [Allomuricauda parva]
MPTLLFKLILTYISHLNIVIATSAGLLAAGIANIFNLDQYLSYGQFAFFSTLCVYNLQRVVKVNLETKTPWLSWVGQHRTLIILISIVSGLLGGYFFVLLLNEITPIVMMLMVGATTISFYYVVRIGSKNLRELPHLKIHLIALTWTIIIVVFPMLNENIHNWETFIIFIPAHYLYFAAVAIPFDIRDLKYDLPSQRTIPQVIGIPKAKIISILLLILVLISLGVVSSYSISTPLFVLAIIVQMLLILYSTEKRKDFYYSILIDGAIALLGVSYLIR